MTYLRQHRWLQGLLLIGPAAAWCLAFIVAPTVYAVLLSFWRFENYHLVHKWNLHNYGEFLHVGLYQDGLVKAIVNGIAAAIIATALSIPVAHFIHFHVKRHRALFLGAVVVALWLGYLLRIFGWRILLGDSGILNTWLEWLGVIDHPLSFLVFSRWAVWITQAHLAMPFAFIPIYAAMERVPRTLLDAGSDLGADRRRQFLRVELPLIARGVSTGATFAFILAFGDYFAPVFVGPPSGQTIANSAVDQFRQLLNWPQGAALGVVMMITILFVLVLPSLLAALIRLVLRRTVAERRAWSE